MEEDEDEKMEDAEEEEEAVLFCGVDTNEDQEEEAMVGLVYSHNRRGSTQHVTRATLDDTCPNLFL